MYRMIFVDDEDLIRDFFAEMMDFSTLGFELAAVLDSGESALSYLDKDPDIDVVITDIKMGQTSGLDLCEILHQKNPSITLILLTGYRNFEYAQRAIWQNVFDYLVKPSTYADVENLLVRLKKHLDQEKKAELADSPHYSDVVQVMQKLAKEHFSQNFSLENAAEALSMNPAYLSRLFKQQCSQTYSDYLVSLRVERAKELLADPRVKVYEIGYEIGYKNTQHFYKVFKQLTGMTPSEYRSAQITRKE